MSSSGDSYFQMRTTILGILLLAQTCLSAYIYNGFISVGTFALCSDTCQQTANLGCTGRCITFRDNSGSKNLQSLQYLTEVCWQIISCAEFPKFFAFQTDTDCSNNCEVNVFPGFSRLDLNQIDALYYAKGYNMMCTAEANTDSPFPNICELATPYAVQGSFQQIAKIAIALAMFVIVGILQ